MISVAMTTYNGEKYIKKQLLSICEQTKLPDEIVICDDKSIDKTISAINEVKLKYPNIKWDVVKNESNIGYANNFRRAINKCKGDYIFLSDQDDIWHKDKIEKMYNAMEENKSIKILFSSYECIDANDEIITNFKYKYNNSILLFLKLFVKKIVKLSLKQCLLSRNIAGMTMCIRNDKTLFNKFNMISDKDLYCHDAVLAMIAAKENGLYMYNIPLVNYRLHDANSTGLDNIKDNYKPDRVEWLKYKIKGTESILKCACDINDIESKNILENEIELTKYRIDCLENKKLPSFVNIFSYNSILAYFSDIYYVCR